MQSILPILIILLKFYGTICRFNDNKAETMTERPTSDIAFTDAVKSAQQRLGSRAMFARLEQQGGWRASITDELASFIATRDSLYFATANAD